mgnify:CR=1 FL=1
MGAQIRGHSWQSGADGVVVWYSGRVVGRVEGSIQAAGSKAGSRPTTTGSASSGVRPDSSASGTSAAGSIALRTEHGVPVMQTGSVITMRVRAIMGVCVEVCVYVTPALLPR